MVPQLKNLMQIGIIVKNVDEAVAEYEKMGITGWNISVMDNTIPPFTDLTFDGKELETKGGILKTAMLSIYGMELELIEPLAPETAYYKWLQEHGPGIHHLAFGTNDNYDMFLDYCKKSTGKDPWVRGKGIHGLMDFSYVDLREKMGLIVECYNEVQSNKAHIPYNMEPKMTE